MDWLYQNWIWIAVFVGGYFLMSRMGIGGCGMGHSHGPGHSHAGGSHEPADGAHEDASHSTEFLDPVTRMVGSSSARPIERCCSVSAQPRLIACWSRPKSRRPG